MKAIPKDFDYPVGSRIPGSQYLRDYCSRCGEPMRVEEVGANYCEDCCPKTHFGGGNKNVELSEIQYHGGRFYSGEW